MTDIRIQRLSLENFKSHKSLCIDFNGRSCSIYGDNATGKTSVYDGLLWLLFGTDSAGNGEKNMEIKPLDAQGNVKDHLAVTAVEAVLTVNGEELSLRRTYKELWSTKRGSSEASFDGNTSEYYIDGVPCKRYAFQEKVGELVDEETFRQLTNVSWFASQLRWQDRRERLFDVAGVQCDGQILQTDQRFAPLVESMGKLSLEDYRKKLQAEKKKLVGAKTEIPARISECEKTIADVAGLDFAGARAQIDALNGRKEALSAQLAALDNDTAAQSKSMEIREAQLELTTLENENKAYRASQGAPLMNVRSLENQLLELQMQRNRTQNDIDRERNSLEESNRMIADARAAWKQVYGETFTGDTCHACGQKLPEAALQRSRDTFEAGKKSRLQDIEGRADYYKGAKQRSEQRLAQLQETLSAAEGEIAAKAQQIADAKVNVVQIADMEGYALRKADIQSRIDKLNEELFEIHESVSGVKVRLRQEMSAVQAGITEQMELLGKESLLDYTRSRVEQLRQDARNSAQCLEAIEKMLYLMDEYSRYKTGFVEDSVNSLFRIARFRLFREQANGGIEDRCDVVYDGVPYMGLNNGMKVNVGIDIINTLSKAYGVRVPLFVDNAESVTRLEKCGSQIVRLVVSESDKELRVDYES